MSKAAKLALEELEKVVDLRHHINKEQIAALREVCKYEEPMKVKSDKG